jgi:hypothetical protein
MQTFASVSYDVRSSNQQHWKGNRCVENEIKSRNIRIPNRRCVWCEDDISCEDSQDSNDSYSRLHSRSARARYSSIAFDVKTVTKDSTRRRRTCYGGLKPPIFEFERQRSPGKDLRPEPCCITIVHYSSDFVLLDLDTSTGHGSQDFGGVESYL